MKVSKVYPGTAAEKGGLRVGDVIRSINGYLTEQPGNLAWIIATAAPDKVLKIDVRGAGRRQRRHGHCSTPLTMCSCTQKEWCRHGRIADV